MFSETRMTTMALKCYKNMTGKAKNYVIEINAKEQRDRYTLKVRYPKGESH